MKIKSLIINLYYNFRYDLLKAYWDWCAKHSKVHGIALMYHHITDEHVDINESCQHRIKEFKDTLLRLRNEGYTFISINDALPIIKKGLPSKFALVTFDDVPENVYTNAYPILKQLGIPFTLFVTTGFVDTIGYLSKSQLVEMDSDELCTVGAHTMTHPMLRKVNNAKEELKESKKILEDLLKHEVKYMAYPYGRQSSISHHIMKLTKDVGYECAFGTIQSPISDVSKNNMYYLQRMVIK